MKKLLVALAVVASIGVSLSESNVVSNGKANYNQLLSQGYSETAALSDATCYWLNGATLGQVFAY